MAETKPARQTHPLLQLASIRHGFYSRNGGISGGIYASLNCGVGSRDDPQHVARNHHLVAADLATTALLTLHQIHSSTCLFVDQPFATTHRPQADAMVTRTAGLALGALAADCMTVLFAAPGSGLIAAAHAGWKGSVAGILENTIVCMIRHGADPANIRAVFGPCLRPPCFEVGLDLVTAFTSKFPASAQFFSHDSPEKHQFDLVGFGHWRLEQAGLDPANIGDVGGNTLAQPEKYFSYRHAQQIGQTDYGRHVSAICLEQ